MPGEMGNETHYVVYLRKRVGELLEDNPTFTIRELSEKSGLKVTPHMRRRLRQWVDLNYLDCWYRPGKMGRGSRLIYMLHTEPF